MNLKPLFGWTAGIVLGSLVLPAAPAHDLIICASINRNYVIGSKLVTLSGLYRRTGDTEYQHFGNNFPGVFQVAIDPRDERVIYTATLNGEMHSVDGGKQWRIGTSWDMTEAKDIALDPNAPDTIYLALPDGVAVSTDRGTTWPRQEKGLPERGKYTHTIEVDRTKAGRVLAGCESGIYLTENGAKSWKKVFAAKATVDDIQQSPHDPKLWLAATQSDGLQISRDGGLTWKKDATLPAENAWYNVAFDAQNPQRFVLSSWTYGVRTTEDGGKTWTERNDGLPEGHCVFRVGVDPDNSRLYAAVYQDSLYISDDFGKTWKKGGLEGSTVYNFKFVARAAK